MKPEPKPIAMADGDAEVPAARQLQDRRREKSWAMVRRHYHDRGWQHANSHYVNLLAEIITQGAAVLDVGCGRSFPMAGHLLACGAEVHGIDPVAEPTEASPGVICRRGTAEHIPYPDSSFDVVTSRSVLEHIKDPGPALREFRRVLKPGGCVVFLTPNKYDYVSLAARVIPNRLHGRVVRLLEGRDEQDTFPTYYRANSRRQIHRLAATVGLRVERLEFLNNYPSMLMFSPPLCRLGIAYDRLIRAVPWLHWLQGSILGVLRTIPDLPAPMKGATP